MDRGIVPPTLSALRITTGGIRGGANSSLLKEARRVLEIEAQAILEVKRRLTQDFVKAVEILAGCQGRVVVTGIGKSGLIGRKISATFASTGTPSLFLHPAEGIHGDLGVLVRHDVVLAVSHSGESQELLKLLPTIKRIGLPLIAMTGHLKSTLATNSTCVIDVHITEEACPMGLAPTASTTAALALGDALAIALLSKKKFRQEDFALLHPGGSLGTKIFLKVEDIMRRGQDIPLVHTGTNIKDAILEMTTKKMGCTAVVDHRGKLAGIITDQDLRKMLQRDHHTIWGAKVESVMTRHPRTIAGNELVARAIRVTEEFSISTLVVVDRMRKPVGIVHLHDLLKAHA